MKHNIWLCLQVVTYLAGLDKRRHGVLLRGDTITYFVNLQRPLPAATAGVMLRTTRGVGPNTCQCGTLHWCDLYFPQQLISNSLPNHWENCTEKWNISITEQTVLTTAILLSFPRRLKNCNKFKPPSNMPKCGMTWSSVKKWISYAFIPTYVPPLD